MPGLLRSKILAGKQKSYDTVHYLCTVKFLDNSDDLTVTYQRSTTGRFLLEHVCSSIDLIEKDYFGLKYTDTEKQECWLDLTKTIHQQIKGLSNPVLLFRVRYYPSDLNPLKEEITRYQLFLQVRDDFNAGRLICSLEDALVLSAYIVQEELGDYDNLSETTNYVAGVKLPALLSGYEENIKIIHQQLKEQDQATVEYKFLKKASSLVSYGIDPYVVADIKGNNMYLTVTPQGIIIFQDNTATNVYQWHLIKKLSFDGKMFYIRLLDNEKVPTGRSSKSHLNMSFLMCASANKSVQQTTTVGYKCLNQQACKKLWKNAVAQKYFYTLQSSDEAPRVLSSGGLFTRGSKFRYSGNCMVEACKNSALIERQEPKFTRHQSHGNIESRLSTLSYGRRMKESEDGGSAIVTHHSSYATTPNTTTSFDMDCQKQEQIEQGDIKKSSNDSAFQLTPSQEAPIRSPPPITQSAPDDVKFKPVNLTSNVGTAECNFYANFQSGDESDLSAPCKLMNRFVAGNITSSGESTALSDVEQNVDTGDGASDKNYPSNDAGNGGVGEAITEKWSETIIERWSTDVFGSTPASVNTATTEGTCGYDTGYISSGSEKLSRSYEENGNLMKSNRILEEMEFPSLDGNTLEKNNTFLNETETKTTTIMGFPEQNVKPTNRSYNVREDLLSLLSYTPSELNSGKRVCRFESGEFEKDGSPKGSSLSLQIQTSSSNPQPISESRQTSSPFISSPSLLPTTTPSATGVLSRDNFQKMKEIEQMIRENKDKIKLIKNTINSEISRSGISSADSTTLPPYENQVGYVSDAIFSRPYLFAKQPKHVSFLSENSERPGGNGVLADVGGRCAENNFGDGDPELGYKSSSSETCNTVSRISGYVEKTPNPATGSFISSIENYRFFDNGVHEDEVYADHPKDGDKKTPEVEENMRAHCQILNDPSVENTYQQYTTPHSMIRNLQECVRDDNKHTSTILPNSKKDDSSCLLSSASHKPSSIHSSSLASMLLPPTSFLSSSCLKNGKSFDNPMEGLKDSALPCDSEPSGPALMDNQEIKRILVEHYEAGPNSEESEIVGPIKQDQKSEAKLSCTKESRGIFKGVERLVVSATLAIAALIVFFILMFELDQEIPYLTDLDIVKELRESLYMPARQYVLSYLKN